MASLRNLRLKDVEKQPNTNKCKFCGREYQTFYGDDGFCSRVCASQYHLPKEVRDFEKQITDK